MEPQDVVPQIRLADAVPDNRFIPPNCSSDNILDLPEASDETTQYAPELNYASDNTLQDYWVRHDIMFPKS